MALIVEDGSGVAGANSYVTLAEADTYCLARYYSSWATLTDPDKEYATLRAMTFIECQNWKGYKADKDNVLEWPRTYVYDKNDYAIEDDEIPINLKYALIEAAYLESITPGTLQPDYARGGGIKYLKADTLELEYFPNAVAETIRTKINGLLFGLVIDSNKLIRV